MFFLNNYFSSKTVIWGFFNLQFTQEMDDKIAKLDAELGKYREQLKKLKAGSSARKQVEQRAMNV